MPSMRTAVLFISCVALAVSAAVTEPETIPALPAADFDVSLHAKDSSTLAGFPGKVVRVVYSSASGESRTSVTLLPNSSEVRTTLDAGEWRVFAEIDDLRTPGSDYAGMLTLSVSNSTSADLLLEQTGSVTGFVYDEHNRSVAGTRLHLQCVSSFYDPAVFGNFSASDEFGAFSSRFVPAETPCTLLASFNGKLGSADVRLARGELKSLRIVLTREKAVSDNPWTSAALIAALVIGLLAITAYLLFFKPKPKHHQPAARHQQQKAGAKTALEATGILRTKKMQDVTNTLPEGERRVVEFLLENDGRSRQSKIFYALLIPKTTLSRLLYSLENKNIVKTQKFGKIKQVELSEWFMQ